MEEKEEKVYFKDSQGNQVCGILLNPAADANRPVVMLCHGLASNKNTNSFAKLKEVLAGQNIATFRFDFFGHGESEGDFADLTVTAAVDDIVQADAFLKKQGFKKIGLVGSSFGGISSIVAAEQLPDLAFLALKSPVSNWKDKAWDLGKAMLEEWKRKGYREYISGYNETKKIKYGFYEDAIKYDGYQIAPKIKMPVFIVHGDADESVSVEQSRKISKIFPNCQLKIIPGADHRYLKPQHMEEMLKGLSEFIIRQV